MNNEIKSIFGYRCNIEIVFWILNTFNMFCFGFLGIGKFIEQISLEFNQIAIESFLILAFLCIVYFGMSNIFFYGIYLYIKKIENHVRLRKFWLKKTLYFILLLGSVCFVFREVINFSERLWWINSFLIVIFFNGILIFPYIFSFYILGNKNNINESVKTDFKKIFNNSGIQIDAVFEFNRKNNGSNENVIIMNIGIKRNLLISEEIFGKFSEEELKAVIYHEICHVKNKHSIKLMGLSLGFLFLIFLTISIIMGRVENNFITIFRIVFYLNLFLFLTQIIIVSYSKKNEFEADEYAVKMMGTDQWLISALIKYEELNKNYKSIISEEVFNTHPTIKRRIENIERL